MIQTVRVHVLGLPLPLACRIKGALAVANSPQPTGGASSGNAGLK
eukprot:COSAG02_NODE_24841_length_676_cov_0.982669_2_plen_44_part_01